MYLLIISKGVDEGMQLARELIIDLIEAIILLSVYQIFMDEKKYIIENKIKSLVFCTIFTAFVFWSSTYITMMYHTLFNVSFSVFLLVLVTRINLWSATVVYFVFLAILLITEMSVGTLEMLLFHSNMEEILINPNYLAIFTVATKFLQIVIVFLLFRFNFSIKRYKLFTKESSIYYNFIFSIGILGIFTFGVSTSNFGVSNTVVYNVVLFVFYIAFFILSIRDFKERDRLLNIKNKYQIQEHQIKNMEEIISIIRQEKHDYANHINVIQALCCLNKPNTIERIKSYVSEISETIHASFRLLDTGNDYIDGILSIKCNYAIKNQIDFKVIINEPFSTLKIKEDELISIVSNLVDNAFESFGKDSSIENKKVSLETYKEDGNFIIKIMDNGEAIPEGKMKDIFAKGFSTKEDKSGEHGFGLFITKELVQKNHGVIFAESNVNETVFSVRIDVNKSC